MVKSLKDFQILGQSHDLHNLGLRNVLCLMRVETIPYDAEGGVLDCFNSSEKLCIFNLIFSKS